KHRKSVGIEAEGTVRIHFAWQEQQRIERQGIVASGGAFTESRWLDGQVAAVTGGGRGIGRAIALALAEAGASTAVLARSQAELDTTVQQIEQSGGKARAFVSDVRDALTISRTVKEIEQSLGPVSLLVNNAATFGPIGPFWETCPDR